MKLCYTKGRGDTMIKINSIDKIKDRKPFPIFPKKKKPNDNSDWLKAWETANKKP